MLRFTGMRAICVAGWFIPRAVENGSVRSFVIGGSTSSAWLCARSAVECVQLAAAAYPASLLASKGRNSQYSPTLRQRDAHGSKLPCDSGCKQHVDSLAPARLALRAGYACLSWPPSASVVPGASRAQTSHYPNKGFYTMKSENESVRRWRRNVENRLERIALHALFRRCAVGVQASAASGKRALCCLSA